MKEFTKKEIEDASKFLTEKEVVVLRLRFGFYGDQPRTLREVGDMLNLSRERIRQIQAKASRKIMRKKNPPIRKGPRIGFCLNSRIWIDVAPEIPATCPYIGGGVVVPNCEAQCGYYKKRRPTKYILRKLEIIKSLRVASQKEDEIIELKS